MSEWGEKLTKILGCLTKADLDELISDMKASKRAVAELMTMARAATRRLDIAVANAKIDSSKKEALYHVILHQNKLENIVVANRFFEIRFLMFQD